MTTDQPGRKGSGTVMMIEPVNPGAGAQVVIPVPAGTRWRIMAFYYELQADITAINRNMGYSIHPTSGLTSLWLYNNLNVGAVALGHMNVMASSNVDLATLVAGYATLSMPDIYIDQTSWIQSQVMNMQAGDLILNTVLTLERWAIG